MVILPTKLLSSSTTGAETKSFFSKRRAISFSEVKVGIGSSSGLYTSPTFKLGSEVSKVLIGKDPLNLFSFVTTYRLSVDAGRSTCILKYLNTTSRV